VIEKAKSRIYGLGKDRSLPLVKKKRRKGGGKKPEKGLRKERARSILEKKSDISQKGPPRGVKARGSRAKGGGKIKRSPTFV